MDLLPLRWTLESLVGTAGLMAQEERKSIERELKPDGSIVTNADRAVEAWLRKELVELLPGTSVWGEEEGYSQEASQGLWLVDPIDGTSNFAFGSPLWGVSVALARSGEILAGAVALPDLGELYGASKHGGATINGEPLPRLIHGPIHDEELVSFSDGLLTKYPDIRWPGKMRYSGAFVVDAMFVAAGRLRGMIDYKCKLYDIAASIIICSELDADIRYADGSPLVIDDIQTDCRIGKPFLIFPRGSGFSI